MYKGRYRLFVKESMKIPAIFNMERDGQKARTAKTVDGSAARTILYNLVFFLCFSSFSRCPLTPTAATATIICQPMVLTLLLSLIKRFSQF